MTNNSTLPTVSICTVTYNRGQYIPLLTKCVNNQDYPHQLIEWVVIDDSDDPTKCSPPNQDDTDVKIKYIRLNEKLKLGAKRNLSHTHCSGDIIVYMDDDDYYFPSRVSHAVERLQSTGKEVAGATYLYIYYAHDDQVWTSGPFGKNHATAGTFAMTKKFANETFYEVDAETGEETAFLSKFTKDMAQLSHNKTLICISHSNNTFDKRLCRTLGKSKQINRLEEKQENVAKSILAQSGHRQNKKPSKEKLDKFPIVLVCGAWGSGIAEICSVIEGLGVVFPSPYHSSKQYYDRRSLESQSFRDSILSVVNEENLLRFKADEEIIHTLNLNKISLFEQSADEFTYGLCAPASSAVLKELDKLYDLTIIFCLRDYQSIERHAKAQNWPDHYDWEGASIVNNQCLNFIAQTDSRFLIIRHKDIYEKPVAAAYSLCQFLHLGKNINQVKAATLMMRKFGKPNQEPNNPATEIDPIATKPTPIEEKNSLKEENNNQTTKKKKKNRKNKKMTVGKGFT